MIWKAYVDLSTSALELSIVQIGVSGNSRLETRVFRVENSKRESRTPGHKADLRVYAVLGSTSASAECGHSESIVYAAVLVWRRSE